MDTYNPAQTSFQPPVSPGTGPIGGMPGVPGVNLNRTANPAALPQNRVAPQGPATPNGSMGMTTQSSGGMFGFNFTPPGYSSDWQQKALDAGKDVNSAEFSDFRAYDQSLKAQQASGSSSNGAFDLNGIYDKLYSSSGISDLEKNLSDKTNAYNAAQKTINDNPWLSEADRTGRISKLSSDYNNNIANLKNDIATKKADIETKLNIQTKQFDINSQQAQQALSQFNSLLQMGALNGLSGTDIANLTKATGLPSSMIQNAIKNANTPQVKPYVTTQTDDNGNVTVVTIDENTGKVISTNDLGAIGKATKTSAKSGGESQKESVAAKAQSDKEGAAYMIELYRNVNPSNPSWQKGHLLRQNYSPQDFYKQLLVDYPDAASYIKGAFIEGAS